ncbi:MAG: HAD family hydrolase [Bacteriovoracaceae bacterium]
MKIKAVIFDMDGVVVNNHEYHFKAWMDFAEKYGFELNEEIYKDQFNGKTNKDLFRIIFDDPTDEEIAAYGEEKESMYREAYYDDLAPHTGLLDFLSALKRGRYKIALATSAPTENVDWVLDNLQLRPYFDVIVDGTEVDNGKPDPEIYLTVCTKLEVDPQYCVVFEDSLAGLESAKEAGCCQVGIATSHEPWELEGHTEHIIHDFTEVKGLWMRLEK